MNVVRKALLPCLFALIALALQSGMTWADRAGLPPAPPGVEDLRFEEFFRLPAGRLGLEPSDHLMSLNGKRVRALGYVVTEEQPTSDLFLLTAHPVALAEQSDGPADYLPPATLFVHLAPIDTGKVVSHQPGLLVVTGMLEVGNREETNGRISFVRLRLDQPLEVAQDAAEVLVHSGHSPALNPDNFKGIVQLENLHVLGRTGSLNFLVAVGR